MRSLGALLAGVATILAVITADKATGVSTKIVTTLGITPK